jgi:hypothetical protein
MAITRMLAIVSAAAVVLIGMGCGGSSTVSVNSTPKGQSKAFRWGVISTTPSQRTIKIGGSVSYCEGDPRPRISQPEIRYEDISVYIEVVLERPRHHRSKGDVCLGSELLVAKMLKLRRNLAEIELYDSGVDPPERRWP